MCQQIEYSGFLEDCDKQNTKTISEILAIGDTVSQQVGMCKTQVRTLYLFDIFFEDFIINMKKSYKSVLKYVLIQKYFDMVMKAHFLLCDWCLFYIF